MPPDHNLDDYVDAPGPYRHGAPLRVGLGGPVGSGKTALLERTLELATSGDIRTQDAPFLLSAVESNRDVGALAWAYVRDHWDELVPRFASSNVIHLAYGVRVQTAPDVVADVQAFFREHDIPQNHLMLLQALERQRVFAALRERAAGELAERFGGPA